MDRVRNRLRQLRQERGLSQQELAERAGVTRQTVSGIESGRYLPTVPVALRLARALGCRVEDLFDLEAPADPLPVRLASPARPEQARGARAVLAEVRGVWVAHPLIPGCGPAGLAPADALLEAGPALQAPGEGSPAGRAAGKARRPCRGRQASEVRSSRCTARARPLQPLAELRRTVLLAGCDPALGLLCTWLASRGAPCRPVWVHAASRPALAMLQAGEVHLAGVHLLDEASGSYNVAAARRAFPGQRVLLVHLARWEQGLLLAPGNPLGIRWVEDLADPRVRLVNREPGSGARELLDRLLRRAGIPPEAVRGYRQEVTGHLAVAQAIALGAADVGIGTRAAAEAFNLEFIPLSLERFDLVLTSDLAEDPRVQALLEAVSGAEFRRQLGALAGYDAGETGRVRVLAQRGA